MALEQVFDCATGEVFTRPAPAFVPTVPSSVSRRQAKLALLSAGKLAGVDAAIASMASPQREIAEIEWKDATEFRRDSPTLIALGAALGLSESQVDDLFIAAAAL